MALPSAHVALSPEIRMRLNGHVQLAKKEDRATSIKVKMMSGYQMRRATTSVRCATKKISLYAESSSSLSGGQGEIAQQHRVPTLLLPAQTCE